MRFINIEREINSEKLAKNSQMRTAEQRLKTKIDPYRLLGKMKRYAFEAIETLRETPEYYAFQKKQTNKLAEVTEEKEDQPMDEISKKIIARAYSGQMPTQKGKYSIRPTIMRE